LDEVLLIEGLKHKKPEAYRSLITDYGDRVYNTVLSMLQHAEEAEDVVQEVFIAVYQNISKFRGDAKLSTWVYRIAITKSLEALRKKKRRKEEAFHIPGAEGVKDLISPFHHPGVQLEHKEQAAVLFAAIARLPDTQQTAFVLHKMEGLSYLEISGIMETTLSGVESLMYRAKQSLQKHLAEYYHKHY
jgi:RNA polymerase sigma-70 factor (ECF subfamily)